MDYSLMLVVRCSRAIDDQSREWARYTSRGNPKFCAASTHFFVRRAMRCFTPGKNPRSLENRIGSLTRRSFNRVTFDWSYHAWYTIRTVSTLHPPGRQCLMVVTETISSRVSVRLGGSMRCLRNDLPSWLTYFCICLRCIALTLVDMTIKRSVCKISLSIERGATRFIGPSRRPPVRKRLNRKLISERALRNGRSMKDRYFFFHDRKVDPSVEEMIVQPYRSV